jgi:hypothetical protein
VSPGPIRSNGHGNRPSKTVGSATCSYDYDADDELTTERIGQETEQTWSNGVLSRC